MVFKINEKNSYLKPSHEFSCFGIQYCFYHERLFAIIIFQLMLILLFPEKKLIVRNKMTFCIQQSSAKFTVYIINNTRQLDRYEALFMFQVYDKV